MKKALRTYIIAVFIAVIVCAISIILPADKLFTADALGDHPSVSSSDPEPLLNTVVSDLQRPTAPKGGKYSTYESQKHGSFEYVIDSGSAVIIQ